MLKGNATFCAQHHKDISKSRIRIHFKTGSADPDADSEKNRTGSATLVLGAHILPHRLKIRADDVLVFSDVVQWLVCFQRSRPYVQILQGVRIYVQLQSKSEAIKPNCIQTQLQSNQLHSNSVAISNNFNQYSINKFVQIRVLMNYFELKAVNYT